MRTAWKVTTQPAVEPLSTADAKTWLKVDASADDDLIADLVSAARIVYEKETGNALISQTITQVWDCFPTCRTIELSVGGVTSVTAVKYITGGTLTTWDSANYDTDLYNSLARVVRKENTSWPDVDNVPNAVQVVYAAGYANAAAVPEHIIAGIKLLVAFWYENREDIPINESNNPRVRSALSLFRRDSVNLV